MAAPAIRLARGECLGRGVNAWPQLMEDLGGSTISAAPAQV